MMDNVNSPKHYQQGAVETIYTIRDTLGPEGFKAYCMGNWIKYNARYRHKNGEEDLRKAEVYLGWAVNGLPEPVNGMLPTTQRKFKIGDSIRFQYGAGECKIARLDDDKYWLDNGTYLRFLDEGEAELVG